MIRSLAKILARIQASYLSRTGEFLGRFVRRRQRIRAGPFAGMRYIDRSYCSVLVPKLLGTYEIDLVPAIEDIVARAPTIVTVVGAAEGYYVAGMALRLPDSKVIAYEAEESARRMLDEMIELNTLSDRVEVRSGCTESDLFDLLKTQTEPCLIMDVEGSERTLLSRRVIQEIQRGFAVIELHGDTPDPMPPGEVINERVRNGRELCGSFVFLPRHIRRHLMNEQRPEPQRWLVTKPLGGA